MQKAFDIFAVIVLIAASIVYVICNLFSKYEHTVGTKYAKKFLRTSKIPLSYRQIYLISFLAIALMLGTLFYLLKRGYLRL